VLLDLIEPARQYKLSAEREDADGKFRYSECLRNWAGVALDRYGAAPNYRMAADPFGLAVERGDAANLLVHDQCLCHENGVGDG